MPPDPQRHERLSRLVLGALDLPESERAAYLDRACVDDANLRDEVEALLAREHDARRVLQTPALGADFSLAQPAQPERIGPYRILDRLGEGGFGVVYLAEQTAPVRRRVALKIVKLGMDTEDVVARFAAERQALALMDHPNVAMVFDAGATDTGRPYFVMEYVRGEPITDYCDRHALAVPERLELFVSVCKAIQHAHQKGVIHRDIKPGNILVENREDEPFVKVIDFGIAKALHQRLSVETVYTQRGQMIGTPSYMSPEQADLSSLDVDTRSDIYSLGVLLYELLTGALPFDILSLQEAGLAEIRRVIREVEPLKPSTRITEASDDSGQNAKRRGTERRTLRNALRGDLDWITMMALAKDRTRRYASASDLAADIERHLADEPVSAGPPSTTYALRKFVRRHRALATGTAAVFAILLGALVAIAAALQRAQTESAKSAEVATFVQTILAGIDPATAGRHDKALLRILLDRAAARLGELEDQPDVQAQLHRTIGRAYYSLGLVRDAEPHFQRVVELSEEVAGVAHAQALLDLAWTLWRQDRCVEAVPLCERALAAASDSDGDLALDARHLRANLHGHFREFATAEREISRVIARRSERLSPNDRRTLEAGMTLVALLRAQWRWDEAEAVTLDLLRRSRQRYGEDHPLVQELLEWRQLSVDGGSDAFGGETYAAADLASQRHDVLGPHHSGTISSLRRVAGDLSPPEGTELLRELLDKSRDAVGDRQRETLAIRRALIEALLAADRPAEAEQQFDLYFIGLVDQHGVGYPVLDEWIELACHVTARARGLERGSDGLRAWCREVLRRGDSTSAGVLEAALAMQLAYEGDEEGFENHFQRALGILRDRPPEELRLIAPGFDSLGIWKPEYAAAIARLLEGGVELQQRATGDHPVVASTLHLLAWRYRELGEHDRALETFERELALRQRLWGESDSAITLTLKAMAFTEEHRERWSAAEVYWRRALELRRAAYGPSSLAVANILEGLRHNLRKQRRYDEAMAVTRDAIAIAEARLEAPHPRIARYWNDLGNLADDDGRSELAAECYDRSLAIQREVRRALPTHSQEAGIIDRSTMWILHAQGWHAARNGDQEEAARKFEEDLQVRIQLFGRDSAELGVCYNAIATTYETRQLYDQAASYHRQALRVRRAGFGEADPRTEESYRHLARSLEGAGRRKEAEELLAGWVNSLRTSNDDRALYRALRGLGQSTETNKARVKILRSALEILLARPDADPLEVASARHDLGAALLAARENEEAGVQFAEALRIREDHLAPTHALVAESVDGLAASQSNLEQFDEAIAGYRRAYEIRREQLGATHVVTRNTLNSLAWLTQHVDHLEEAEGLFRDLLSAAGQAMGRRSQEYANALGGLAWVLRRRQRNDEAVRVYRQRYDLLQETAGTTDPSTLQAACDLGEYLTDLGESAAAEALLRQAGLTAGEAEGERARSTLAGALYGLGDQRANLGLWQAALEAHEEALAIRDQLPGDQSGPLFVSLLAVARCAIGLGNDERAELALTQALELCDQLDNPADARAGCEHTRASMLEVRGDFAKAAELWRASLRRSERDLGSRHGRTVYARSHLSWLLQSKLSQFDEAIALTRERLRLARETVPPDRRELANALDNLSQRLEAAEEHDEAIAAAEEALEVFTELVGGEALETLHVRTQLTHMRENKGAPLDAIAAEWKEIIELRTQAGADPTHIAWNWNALGWNARRRGAHTEAEACFRRAAEVHEQAIPGDVTAAAFWDSAAGVCAADDRRGAAARYYSMALERTEAVLEDLRATRGDDHAETVAMRDRVATLHNSYSWSILLIPDATDDDLAVALRHAEITCAMSDPERPNRLDTLALAQHRTGDSATAAVTQRHALSLLPKDDEHHEAYRERLRTYDEAAKR